MVSCQDNLAELRQKIHFAEDNLRAEKKNLYRATELYNEEKEKWTAEIQADEAKIHLNDQEIQEKESKLQNLRTTFDSTLQRILVLEAENEKLKKEIQKLELRKQDELNKFFLEQMNMEKEFTKVQELQNELQASSKWIRLLQEKELRGEEAALDSAASEECKQLSNEFVKKIEAFEENLRGIDMARIAPKKEKLRSLVDDLVVVTNQCKEMEQKISDVKRDIQLLEKS